VYEERISHLCPNDCFQAHLSIYRFASGFVKEAAVLDAGSGSGYGAAYLVDRGASRVLGIDLDSDAIASSQRDFPRSNLQYQFQNLSSIRGLEDGSFDLVIASNSLEHVEKVESFFRSARGLLKPTGLLIVAVPIVRNQQVIAEQLSNPFHLNLWTAEHWFRVIQSYFHEVRCHAHLLEGRGFVELFASSKTATIHESEFTFPEVDLKELNQLMSYTAIFLARKPKEFSELPPPDFATPIMDHSVTRRLSPAYLRPLLWVYYRSVYIARYEGMASLFRKGFSKIRPKPRN
jgi:2-polyprenyl-3-methyl-5-hydroxy-6-metoxy-1,4-benzoquinol methylase